MEIYLAGYINSDCLEQCIAWREEVITRYKNIPQLGFMTPLNRAALLEGRISNAGLTSTFNSSTIVHRDYNSVACCDLVLASLDTYGANRPPLGTLCEIAWAFQMQKPIIIISDNTDFTEHPFIKTFASAIFKNLDEMYKSRIINYFAEGLIPIQVY